jgi:uncharacterized tellurite resistance protein B-like protein
MPFKTLMSWLRVEEAAAPEHTPLRDLIDSLDRLEPDRARYLARFAYLLGRVALADRHASDDEVRAMEQLLVDEASLTAEQATVVVGLAKTSNLLFGGTADYEIAREFAEATTYEQKLALGRCLFAVASSDQAISLPEETEIHRIVNQLKILPQDLVKLRVLHGKFLPGRAPGTP